MHASSIRVWMENNKTKQEATAICLYKNKKLKNSAKHFAFSHKTERKVEVFYKEIQVFVKNAINVKTSETFKLFVMKQISVEAFDNYQEELKFFLENVNGQEEAKASRWKPSLL